MFHPEKERQIMNPSTAPADLKQGGQVSILYHKENTNLLAEANLVLRRHETASSPFVPEPNPC
jgi:hypothetical protein